MPTPSALSDTLLIRRLATRGVVLWVAGRTLLGVLMTLQGQDPVRLTPMTTVVFVAACALMSLSEILRQRERTMLANLGVPLTAAVAWSVAVVPVLEMTVRLVVPRQ